MSVLEKTFLLILFLISVFSNGYSLHNCYFNDAELQLSYAIGDYIAIDEDYLEIGFFTPIAFSNCYQPLIDVRGYRFEEGDWGASAGIGMRWDVCNCSLFGVNVFYDYLQGIRDNRFHQIGFGLEWLNCCYDIRLNGYFPLSGRQAAFKCVFDDIGDGFFATSSRIEFPYTGFIAEVGAPVFDYCDFTLYLAAGPYYFNSDRDDFWGGQGRVRLDWRSIFGIEVRFSYDHVFGANFQGVFGISIPFSLFCDPCCDTCCDYNCLFSTPIRRIGIIQTDSCCHWNWNW